MVFAQEILKHTLALVTLAAFSLLRLSLLQLVLNDLTIAKDHLTICGISFGFALLRKRREHFGSGAEASRGGAPGCSKSNKHGSYELPADIRC
jgi:hypothetical protein